ncbi:MAG: biotin--[acetyl-CoA-carboxylase] ligase [Candidatus Thorarchaeota archaeon]
MSDRFECFKTSVLHPRVKSFNSVDSTNSVAKELLIQGETEGLIVSARTQTSGRGRRDRLWLSPDGGLYFSIILKPRFGLENVPLLGILGACAVARSLNALGVKNVRLKWPNDVLIGESKISGILSEAVSVQNETIGIVVGIGVNQNCPVSDMPSGLVWPTTSVIDELGKETSAESLLCSIVNEIDALLQILEEDASYTRILSEWRELSSTLGARVRIHEAEKNIDGVAIDINNDGSLIVKTDDGIVNVLLGDVSHLRTQE